VSLKRFTRPDGLVVLVNPDQVQSVMEASVDLGQSAGAHAIITLVSGAFQAVRETVEEVEDKLQ
jgi:uncharacterized protein YlzI (FlbEa/FlbD family)